MLVLLSETPTLADDVNNADGYVVTELGPNHQVWQRVIAQTNDSGEISYQTNSYTELATGMHHLVGNQWVDSSAAIQITVGGGVATNCQHQVAFAANINTSGAIDVTMPDGNHLRSHILGLSYFDPTTGQYALIASLKDSTGQVTGAGSNQVIYADAFNGGFKADVSYSNSTAGFSQEILLREQPPSPSTFGLNPTNTRLQVLTEFLAPPTPQMTRETMSDGTTVDSMVDFGNMQIIQGQAFSLGSDDANNVPVNKHWLLLNNRHVLVEDVPFPIVAPQLNNLPAPSNGSNTNRGASADGLLHRVLVQIQLPSAPTPAKRPKTSMKLAKLSSMDKGFLLDYTTVTSQTNFTFQADKTYYLSAAVTLSQTTTLEGGTVIKYPTFLGALVSLNGPLVSMTGPYRPAVFTSRDDNTVGETISGSSGSPSIGSTTYIYGNSSQTNDYKYLRMLYAGVGVSNAVAATVWHSQFIKCGTAVSAAGGSTVTLRNVLITQGTNCVSTTGSVVAEQLTSDQIQKFCALSYGGAKVTNSILTSVTDQTGVSVDHSTTNGTGLYQGVGGGNYYLVTSSTNQGGGTTNINASLLTDLTKKTTYPPTLKTGIISASTTYSTNVQRDLCVPPDKGYHYDPIDWLFNGVTANAALTFNSNTVAGSLPSTSSFGITANSSITFNGTAALPDYLVIANTVQEGCATQGSHPELDFNGSVTASFTRFLQLATPSTATILGNSAYIVTNCEFWNTLISQTGGSQLFTNALFHRTTASYNGSVGPFAMENCTTIGGSWSLSTPFSSTTWTVKDSAFDMTSLTFTTGMVATNVYNHNGFISGQTQLSGTGNVTPTSFNWQKGPLGDFYQPSNSTNINAGSTTADIVHLYHYTTQTDQTKEFNSTVDIGYHYVSVNGSGNPLDANTDGTADYVQDANGNGNVDGAETDWMLMLTDPNNIGPTGLKVYTPLK